MRAVTQEIADTHTQLNLREGKNFPIPYFALELAVPNEKLDLDIVVGPNPHMPLAIEAVNQLLKSFGCIGSARASTVPYREV
jgi:hypothetical protein